MIRTLLVDNHDSFTRNLVHDLTRVNGAPPDVVPNDWDRWGGQDGYGPELLDTYDNVVISPGPGTPLNPADVGICAEVIAAAVDTRTPVLGICLGHQLIAHLYGGTVDRADEPVHGRVSTVSHDGTGLFAGIPDDVEVVRYHSLAVTDVPAAVTVDARSDDGTVMGLSVPGKLLWGVQFHPESVKTRLGPELLANFADLTRAHGRVRRVRDRLVPVIGTDTRALSEQLFRTLYSDARHAVWLDGNSDGDDRARFSVMGAADGPQAGPSAAVATADVAAGTVTVTRGGQGGTEGGNTVHTDILTWLADDLARWNIRGGGLDEDLDGVRDGDLPFGFRLGWVGYLGYGVKADCMPGEGAANRHASPVPDAGLVFLDRAVVVDHEYGEVHLLGFDRPRETDAGPWAVAEETAWREKTAAVVRQCAVDLPDAGPDGGPDGATLAVTMHDRAGYVEKVRRVQQLIRDGETYEACLTTTLTAEATGTGTTTLDLYHRLRRDNPAPFASYLRLPGATVMSTSPERFLSVDADGQVTSSPIKGTRPVAATEEENLRTCAELQSSEKDRAENLMIVDLVRHDLGQVAEPGTVQVPELFSVESYATVHQLVSTVTARLDAGRTGVDAVRAAFPPGSMTGAPKQRTMRLLDELEDAPRGIYSGTVGYFSVDGAVDLSVVIRTLVEERGHFTYGVGGAVVSQSSPDGEYDETVVKATPLLRLTRQ